MSTFDNIKKVAKLRGLSLQDLAKKAGLSSNMIYQYKNATNPTAKTLNKIANVLHVNPNDLLEIDTDDNASTETIPTTVDIEKDPVVLSYGGKPISKEDMEIIKAIIKRHNWQKKE